MELKNKTAIVTGAGRGIGEGIALALAREGASVVLTARSLAEITDVAKRIEAQGGKALPYSADVSQMGDIEGLFKATLEQFGTIDILVNNAGVSHPVASILDLDLEHLDRVFAVDFKGVYLCCRRGGREMVAAGKGGVVINISSIAGLTPLPLAVYGPMKAAVNMLTRILAREWAPHGIRVNAVAPGYVLTPMMRDMIERGERDPGSLLDRTPMHIMLDPTEVAEAVVYLASPGARHVTGVVLPVDAGWLSDGGWSAYPNMGKK